VVVAGREAAPGPAQLFVLVQKEGGGWTEGRARFVAGERARAYGRRTVAEGIRTAYCCQLATHAPT